MSKDPQIQELLGFIKETTMKHASLLATNPDLYPLTMPQNPNLEGIQLTAFRLKHRLETHGYVNSIKAEVNQDHNEKGKLWDSENGSLTWRASSLRFRIRMESIWG